MRLARVYVPRTSKHVSRSALQSLWVRRVPILQETCLRQYTSASSPIPPPLPTETTSKSSGLNDQLHPTGRPPLSPTARSSPTAAADPAAQTESIPAAETDGSSITGGYRTPLRVTNSSTPVAARDTVKVVYEAPLRKAVRGLKAFSISSLLLSSVMTPFILTMEAPLPTVARVSIVTAGTFSQTPIILSPVQIPTLSNY
jgi:hypothetical protein